VSESRCPDDGFHELRSGCSPGFSLLLLLLSFRRDKSISDVAVEYE
jgi:hypothetical protein